MTDKRIVDTLLPITEEERKLLDGGNSIDTKLYMESAANVVNSRKLLDSGKLYRASRVFWLQPFCDRRAGLSAKEIYSRLSLRRKKERGLSALQGVGCTSCAEFGGKPYLDINYRHPE